MDLLTDLPHVREVVHEVHTLADEWNALILKQAYVRGTPQDDHPFETDALIVEKLKSAQAQRWQLVGVDDDTAKANRKEFDDAIAAVDDGCTGAQHGAACSHAAVIFWQGWDKYVAKMTAQKAAA